LLWDIELDSAAATDRLHAMALKRIFTLGGDESEKRHISMMRISPTHVRFLNTAQAATAGKLSAP
jgi:hypothetical protein